MSAANDYLVCGAIDSKGSASHWMRYLRKFATGDRFDLSDEDIATVVGSGELSGFQIATLRDASRADSGTFQYLKSLNLPAKGKQ